MNTLWETVTWDVARAGGFTAYILLTLAVVAGLALSTHGIVLENGMVRLTGSGREVLEHPEIGALYLGGAVSASATE